MASPASIPQRGPQTAWAALCGLLLTSLAAAHYAPALPLSAVAQPARQFGLPFAGAPGPDSWLLGQAYGNTTGAYRQRRSTYGNLQGIHAGLDFSAPGWISARRAAPRCAPSATAWWPRWTARTAAPRTTS
ncbi:hypothetical protein [Deinococcus frigens]|uniref:hypothetical protein n=1 Tax=Deinococcus frigens TaxID=249403 RepID=UPI000B09818F|nr:hypothetical protein [Deinococcus frigens]